jgi:hypothetical protein
MLGKLAVEQLATDQDDIDAAVQFLNKDVSEAIHYF